MLTPDYLKGLPEKLIAIFEELNDYTIADIARRLAKAGEATSTAEWQRIKLQELGAGTRAINKKIAETLGKAEKEVERMFRESSQLTVDNEAEIYEALGIKRNTKFVETLADTLIAQTNGELQNFTKTMGYPMKNGQFVLWTDAYRKALDMAVVKTASGVDDYISAIRTAIKPFTDDGICTIGYQSGRRFTIEAAARMCVLQGISDMASEINERTAKEIGADGWEITAHADCAPDHIDIQGKQYSKKEYEKLNANLARPIGTLGCRHMAFAIILGVSDPVHSASELAKMKRENEKGIVYEGRHYTLAQARDEQRDAERAIRKTKRELIGADKSGDKEAFTAKSIRLRRQRDYYADFSKKAGLLKQNERTQVSRYDRSMSGKALAAEKQAKINYAKQHLASTGPFSLKNNRKSGIINNTLRFDNREKADKVLRPVTERLWEKLTPLEKDSAYRYTEDSGQFNRPLRGYDGSWGNFKGAGKVPLDNEGAEKYINGLKSAIDKAELPESMWLFRGSDQQSLAGLLGVDKSKIIPSNAEALNRKFGNTIVKERAFVSTGVAADAGFSGKVSYEILVPKGGKGIYAEPFSHYGQTNTNGTWDGKQKSNSVGVEAEMILQAGSDYVIKEIKIVADKVTVVMEMKGGGNNG